MPSRKYPQLNDKTWLHQKYVVEKLSTNEIAELAGAKVGNSARQALIRAGIPVRNLRESNVHKRQEDGFIINPEVLTGCLLGDGSLEVFNRESSLCEPYFHKKNKQYDFVYYVASLLFKDPKSCITTDRNKCNGKIFLYPKMRSKSTELLRSWYDDWYPASNGYKKVVPKNIIMTPTVLLHWFMDDGSTCYRHAIKSDPRRGRRKKQVYVTLSSECFSKEDNEFLVTKLAELGLDFKVTPCNSGTGWRLRLPQSQYETFLEVIGPCPVKSMEYKWK